MDSKYMIGIGVAIAAAAGVGIYLYTKKSDPNAAGQMTPSNVKPAVQGAGSAYAPPASTPDKSGGAKVVDFANKQVAAEAECFKQFPDRESAGYIFCLASKGISQL